MRILLINSNRHRKPWPVMPHGLLRVAAALEAAGQSVQVLDLCFSRRPQADIARALRRFEPRAVGVSVRNLDNATGYKTEFLLDDVKREVMGPLTRLYHGPVVLGGGAVSINPREVLDYLGGDLAVVGDGEEAMVLIAERLEAGRDLGGIAGLVQAKGRAGPGRVEPARVRDLGRLPLADPARHLDLGPYLAHDSPLQVQTKRGCALHCVYCTYNQIEGRAYRLRPPAEVADEIEHLMSTTGSDRVEFVDSTFNLPLAHGKEVLKEIIGRGLKLKLSAMGVSPGAVDRELSQLMGAAGFIDACLGVESLDDAVLAGLGKEFNAAQARAAGALLSSAGMPVMWFLLLGGPGETPASALSTLEQAAELAAPWDLVVIGVGMRAYNGAPLARMMERDDPARGDDNFLRPVAFQPEGWSLERFNALAKRACLMHPNFMVYGQDLNYPDWLGRALTGLAKRLAPGRPPWRAFVAVRRLERMLGLGALRRARFRRNYRDNLASLSTAVGRRL